MPMVINSSVNAAAINEGIRNLNYLLEEVLSFSGDKISNLPPKKGEMKG